MIQYLNIMLRGRVERVNQRGATAVEYGLLVALIAAVIVGVVLALGGTLQDVFEGISGEIEDNNPPANPGGDGN